MDGTDLYEDDFVAWTERQAERLRALPSGANGLETHRLAEEIEDLGRAEIREVSSLLLQMLGHLLKLAVSPATAPRDQWLEEATRFQGQAILACSPGIRQRIDLARVWRLACVAAQRSLEQHGEPGPAFTPDCPFTLDELLDVDLDPREAVARLVALRRH